MKKVGQGHPEGLSAPPASFETPSKRPLPLSASVPSGGTFFILCDLAKMEVAMRSRRPWTEEDSDKIKSLAGQVSVKELARQLKRTEAAVRVQAGKLRVCVKSSASAGVRRTVNKQSVRPHSNSVEQVVAPSAIERALTIYQQLQERDQSVVLQAKKILTQHIYGMVDKGECDEQRLTVGGLVHLKAVERDHAIKSAQEAQNKREKPKASNTTDP
jgi:hypothetical protein